MNTNTLNLNSASPGDLHQSLENLSNKQLRALFTAAALVLRVPEPNLNPATTAQDKPHPFTGKFVLCRCYGAGVHAGRFVAQKGNEVFLKDSRRLWSWTAQGPDGVALSSVAQNGLKAGCTVDAVNPEIQLHDVIETIPCSEKATQSIVGA